MSREVAVLGGGERELEIIRGFLAAGYRVRTYGTIKSEEYAGLRAGSLEEAVEGADIVVAPMPGVAVDGSLYAPHSPERIVVDGKVFARTRPGARYFSGRAAAHTLAAAAEHGVNVHDIGADDVVQMHHAVPTAEAAICVAVHHTDMPLLVQRCLVIGYGRIGTLVARYLQGFGVRATVAARRPEIRARAEAIGHQVTGTSPAELSEAIAGTDTVFMTASAPLVTGAVLAAVHDGQLIVDLASPPGGIAHQEARDRGATVIWARAQADSSARYSGRAQFDFIMRTLAAAGEEVHR